MNGHKTKSKKTSSQNQVNSTRYPLLKGYPFQKGTPQIGFSFKGKVQIERGICSQLYTPEQLTLGYGAHQLPNVNSLLQLPNGGAAHATSGNSEGKILRTNVLAAARAFPENSPSGASSPGAAWLLAGSPKFITEPKFILLTTRQVNKSRDKLLEQ